jgi:PilZ domain
LPAHMISSPNTVVGPAPKRRQGESERRISERFTFSAVAEAIDLSSRVRVTARVSDISRTGCYLDIINIFGPGTRVQLNISHANMQFDAVATVAYSIPGMGMGVTFTSVDPEMSAILEQWIAEASGEIAPLCDDLPINRIVQDYPRVERHILGRLIGLMMSKKMLAHEEGADLLDELLRENKK